MGAAQAPVHTSCPIHWPTTNHLQISTNPCHDSLSADSTNFCPDCDGPTVVQEAEVIIHEPDRLTKWLLPQPAPGVNRVDVTCAAEAAPGQAGTSQMRQVPHHYCNLL
jgi:hypothetical protein